MTGLATRLIDRPGQKKGPGDIELCRIPEANPFLMAMELATDVRSVYCYVPAVGWLANCGYGWVCDPRLPGIIHRLIAANCAGVTKDFDLWEQSYAPLCGARGPYNARIGREQLQSAAFRRTVFLELKARLRRTRKQVGR